jgi:hypothetical protein
MHGEMKRVDQSLIAFIDRKQHREAGYRQTRRIAETEHARRIIFLEWAAISTMFLGDGVHVSSRRIARRKPGWFETNLTGTRNHVLAQGNNPRVYE